MARGGTRPHWQDRADEVVALYAQLGSHRKVAKRLGCSPSTVGRIVNEHAGVPADMTEDELQQLADQVADVSPAEVRSYVEAMMAVRDLMLERATHKDTTARGLADIHTELRQGAKMLAELARGPLPMQRADGGEAGLPPGVDRLITIKERGPIGALRRALKASAN